MLAVKLAKRYHRLVKVICIGNEGLTFYRYSRKQLKAAFALVRSKLPRVPLSTSEPITQYGDRMLQSLPDIHLPNIHPSFNLGAKAGVKESVAWVIERAQSLWKVTGKPVLCKETGLPSGGDKRFSPELQRRFWGELLRYKAKMRKQPLGFAAFEAFDLPWKAEKSKLASEAHWGFWTEQRQPKPVLQSFQKLPIVRSDVPTRRSSDSKRREYADPPEQPD